MKIQAYGSKLELLCNNIHGTPTNQNLFIDNICELGIIFVDQRRETESSRRRYTRRQSPELIISQCAISKNE
jgi:hypothetical protein